MASSDSNADVTAELEVGEESDAEEDEPLELTPDEVLEMNSSAEEAFSPKQSSFCH